MFSKASTTYVVVAFVPAVLLIHYFMTDWLSTPRKRKPQARTASGKQKNFLLSYKRS